MSRTADDLAILQDAAEGLKDLSAHYNMQKAHAHDHRVRNALHDLEGLLLDMIGDHIAVPLGDIETGGSVSSVPTYRELNPTESIERTSCRMRRVLGEG